MNENEVRATVRMIDGQLVLDDPDAAAILRVISKRNCLNTLKNVAERVAHFEGRIAALGISVQDTVMVLLNVNDEMGGLITEQLMPGQEAQWQALRDQGAIPFARGLAGRAPLQKLLDDIDPEESTKLRNIAAGMAVIVMDHGVIAVFNASDSRLA